jgi:hypothetical protein
MLEYTEDTYLLLVRDIINYIDKVKQAEPGTALLDIILDFSRRFDVDIETVGDAISSDVYFKSFIEKDCQLRRIFKSPKPEPEW